MKRNKPHINIPQGMNKDTDNSKISLHKHIFGENLSIDNSRPISEGNSSWGYAINRMADSIRAHHTKILPINISVTRSEYLYKHWYGNDLDINIDLIFKRYIRNRGTRRAKKTPDLGIYIAGFDPYHYIVDDEIVAEYLSRPDLKESIDKTNEDLINHYFNTPIKWIEPKEQPIDKYKAIILEQLLTNSVSINMKFNHDSSIRIYNNNIDMTLMQPNVVDAIKQLLIKTLK